jgi:glycosyltransferase involved in cell wall biosynthesis
MIEQGVSIVICCYNGASRLSKTIHHIAQQSVPSDVPWEVILIDNASTDNSAELAKSLWAGYNILTPLQVVFEPQPGLSHARSKGFESARYDFVIMCDDDNWLHHDYVTLVYQIMVDKPNVAALGGRGTLAYETEPPEWIEKAHIFAAGPQATKTGNAGGSKLYGAGCVIRRSFYKQLQALGFKSLLTDRKGIDLSSGGDYELCYAFAIAGYDIWYDERLRFIHFITRDRLVWEYFIRYAEESSKCFDVLEAYKFVVFFGTKRVSMIRLRDFLYCLRVFVKINFRRLYVNQESTEGRLLFFKQIEFKYKLKVLLLEGGRMQSYHEEILQFKLRINRAALGILKIPSISSSAPSRLR